MDSLIIAVSGMVGSGKSTLTTRLADYLGSQAVQERIGDEHPWLERYYASLEGRKRWALHSQLHFLATAVEDIRVTLDKGGLAVIDGTIDEDARVFAAMAAEDGLMEADEAALYRRIYTQLLASPGGRDPDVVIYLSSSFGRAMERIVQRGRPKEQEIGLNYWSRVYRNYERWARDYCRSPILRLDVDEVEHLGDEGVDLIVERLIGALPSLEKYMPAQLMTSEDVASKNIEGEEYNPVEAWLVEQDISKKIGEPVQISEHTNKHTNEHRSEYEEKLEGEGDTHEEQKVEERELRDVIGPLEQGNEAARGEEGDSPMRVDVTRLITRDFAYVWSETMGRQFGLNRNLVKNERGEAIEVKIGDFLKVQTDPDIPNRIVEAVLV